MRINIALKNMLHSRLRTLLSLAGVMLAVVLIFMQLGFLGAVQSTATLVFDRMPFDVMLRSPDYLHLCDARYIARDRLTAVASLPEVESVEAFHVMLNNWQNPQTGEGRAIIVMGAGKDRPPLNVPELQAKTERLETPVDLLIDRKTRADYGPRDGRQFGEQDVGLETDIGGQRVRVAGTFELGTGLAANGAVFTSEAGFGRVSFYDPRTHASLGLVTLRRGVSARQFIASLQPLLADGAMVALTRREVNQLELQRWIYDTPVGRIFQMGVALAFLVGATIVYMVLSTDVTNRLSEYATLSAMGYSPRYLSSVVMQQALLLAGVSYVPAWLIAEGLYRLTSWLTNLPISMNTPRLGMVLVMTVAMCVISGVLALRKLRKVDPAELF